MGLQIRESTPLIDEFIRLPRGRLARYVGTVVLVGLHVAGFVGCTAQTAVAPMRQLSQGAAKDLNLLFITLDTTRADRLGCYGWKNAGTPVLDHLASEGIRFSDVVSVVPVTLPSHATIFSGLVPPNHGVRNNGEYRLDPDHLTMAELFSEHGYTTSAFVSSFVLDARYGLDQGFQMYDDRVEGSEETFFASGVNERRADKVTDAAIQWLEGRSVEDPFLAWVHYFDPHAPYIPPEPFASRFPGRPYDGEIAFVDHQIGRLLNAVKAKGELGRTFVIVVGDHGEGLGEHGENTHSLFAYDSVLRVPLILWCPSVLLHPGTVADRVVSTTDILPTVLELFGIDDAQVRDGTSLLAGPPDPDRQVYFESLIPFLDYGWAPVVGLRRHHDKYIKSTRPEYYNLETDPGETSDLIKSTDSVVRAQVDLLADALDLQLAEWPSFVTAYDSQAVDPGDAERLQALGYLGGVGPGDTQDLRDPKDMIAVATAIQEANALMVNGDLRQALTVIQEIAAVSPDDRSTRYVMAKLQLRLGRLQQAEVNLRWLVERSPRVDVLVPLAQLLLLRDDFEGAGILLEQAEELDPLHGGVHIAWGDVLARQRRTEDALACYRRAAEVDPYRASGAATERIEALLRAPNSD